MSEGGAGEDGDCDDKARVAFFLICFPLFTGDVF
jgi:hypothetical protein